MKKLWLLTTLLGVLLVCSNRDPIEPKRNIKGFTVYSAPDNGTTSWAILDEWADVGVPNERPIYVERIECRLIRENLVCHATHYVFGFGFGQDGPILDGVKVEINKGTPETQASFDIKQDVYLLNFQFNTIPIPWPNDDVKEIYTTIFVDVKE